MNVKFCSLVALAKLLYKFISDKWLFEEKFKGKL